MIVKEFYLTRQDGVNLYKTYSDEGLYIKQIETGIEYIEAIDVENAPYTYEETDKVIYEAKEESAVPVDPAYEIVSKPNDNVVA